MESMDQLTRLNKVIDQIQNVKMANNGQVQHMIETTKASWQFNFEWFRTNIKNIMV